MSSLDQTTMCNVKDLAGSDPQGIITNSTFPLSSTEPLSVFQIIVFQLTILLFLFTLLSSASLPAIAGSCFSEEAIKTHTTLLDQDQKAKR